MDLTSFLEDGAFWGNIVLILAGLGIVLIALTPAMKKIPVKTKKEDVKKNKN